MVLGMTVNRIYTKYIYSFGQSVQEPEKMISVLWSLETGQECNEIINLRGIRVGTMRWQGFQCSLQTAFSISMCLH